MASDFLESDLASIVESINITIKYIKNYDPIVLSSTT